MERLGTKYGGWVVPTHMDLSEGSICYMGGLGEDGSFDVLLQSKYKSNVLIIDPTQKAKIHYNEMVMHMPFTGNIQPDYMATLSGVQYDISKIQYEPIGIWDSSGELRFYKQDNPHYVSQSLISNMFCEEYDIVPVNTLSGIMNNYGHTHIDLLKIDIEGAECCVLNNMLDDNIYPRYVLVEFDLYLKGKDTKGETKAVIDRMLKKGYKILYNENMNITFIYSS